jgi:hypothetical protein
LDAVSREFGALGAEQIGVSFKFILDETVCIIEKHDAEPRTGEVILDPDFEAHRPVRDIRFRGEWGLNWHCFPSVWDTPL